jgi:eukaryotic-like serine/threonine-protein kinase
MNAAAFDAVFWKSVAEAFDQALELDETARKSFLSNLDSTDTRCATEVRRMLQKEPRETDKPVTATPLPSATPSAPIEESGFDSLLHRALHADRMRERSARYRGEMCGPWKLEEIIGTGGMGEVWLAVRADGLYEGKVAVKFLHTDVDAARFEARFTQERALLARLQHPGIARLLDAGRKFGTPYLVIEYVDGTPLLEYVKTHAKSVSQRVDLIRAIGNALAYAHSQLVVHRDIKPSNIFVTKSGEAKLLDFGVAGILHNALEITTESPVTKISGRGLTLEYAAPEQITGEATGVATDVYSLAALAYHVLSGRRAYLPEQPGRAALEYAIVHTDPMRVSEAAVIAPPKTFTDALPPPDMPQQLRGDIDAIIGRALRRVGSDRYATVGDFMSDLRHWSERRPIAARKLDRSYRTKLWLQRNRVAVALSASLFVALTAGLAMSIVQYQTARDEATRATKTVQYMGELLRSADPDLHGGKVPTVSDLLDRAVRETPERFASDSATQGELTRLFAETYRSLNRDAAALPLAERAVALSTEQHGRDALPTLQATRLLADIRFWSNDYQGAATTIEPVIEKLLAKLPPNSLELIETRQRYAGMLCAVYRAEAAQSILTQLITQAEQLTVEPAMHAWVLADIDAERASCFARSAQWQSALDLMKKNAATYANPPAGKIKQGLHRQGYTASLQNLLGDPVGVEATLTSLIEKWRTLAGDKSERIDELLFDLGLYHQHRMDAPEAEKTYSLLAQRSKERGLKEITERMRASLDLLEVRAIYNLAPKDQILNELGASMAVLLREGSPESARFRQNLLRASIIALSLDRLDVAEHYADLARTLGKDKSPGSVIRELQVDSYLLRARGYHPAALVALEKRLASFEQRGEKVSLRRALLALNYSYELYLTNPNEKQKILDAMKQASSAAPLALPQDNRFFVQFNWLQTLVSQGEDSAEHRRARAAVGKLFGRTDAELPRVLNGFFLI